MLLLSSYAVENMGKALSAARVNVHQGETTAATKLVISSVGATTGCAGSGCEHTLKVKVALFDSTESKEVWSGTFKVVAPYMATVDESVVKGFADAVVVELTRTNML